VSVDEEEVALAIAVLVAQNRDHDLTGRQTVRRMGRRDVQSSEQFSINYLRQRSREN
jgi:hypothetical protein